MKNKTTKKVVKEPKMNVEVVTTKTIAVPMGGHVKRVTGSKSIELMLGGYGDDYKRNWSIEELKQLRQAINLILAK